MRIQARQRLLEIWRATTAASFPATRPGDRSGPAHRHWVWGGREQSNSVSDAEQLLCLMLPATEIPHFRLDQPNRTNDEVLGALRRFGDAREIPHLLVRVITDYLRRYADEDGTPIFSGGGLLGVVDEAESPSEAQLDMDMVESFADSVTLTLSALGFARVFKTELTRDDLRVEVDELERLASRRLSAAMVGLLRSFAIVVYDVDSVEGRSLMRTVNQSRLPPAQAVAELRMALRPIAAGLRDLNIGREQVRDLDQQGRLFECGWSWGITEGSPQIELTGDVGEQREGYAQDAPYLYFTVVALDAIADLFSDRTRLLGLLDDDQQRLSTALRIRWDLTQQFWSTIASFGTGRWPLEDIPWRTTDEQESDFFSLLVTSIAARDLAQRRDTDTDLSRLGAILEELANRGRITRRALVDDPALAMHDPGVTVLLEGAEKLGPPLCWTVSDFAPLLLKRSLRVARLINDITLRGRVLRLADDVWDHVAVRRFDDGPYANLWDQPSDVYGSAVRTFDLPSWHHTLRVVESLVFAADLTETHPLRAESLADFATQLLAEAEHVFDQELLAGSSESGPAMRTRLESVRQRLRRCREIMASRPGSTIAILLSVLGDLDSLAAARQDPRDAS